MIRFSRLAGLFVAAMLTMLWAMPAQAQATRTWISGVGDDVNPCSRTAPCKTFPGAISKTAAGGEIDTLDPGGFGAVTVTKAITLANEGIGEAGILVAGTNGITVNCATDPNCVVSVRGLQIDGGPIGSNSLSGIKFVAGKMLVIQNCVIRNFTGGSPNGYGVQFVPSATSRLEIADTSIQTNGQLGSGIGGGIDVEPSSAGNATVMLTRVTVFNNDGNGVKIDMTGATGGSVKMAIQDSTFANNTGGVAVTVPAGNTSTAAVNIDGTTLSNNTIGLATNGTASATITVGRSQITGNSVGVVAGGSSKVFSYGDNAIHDNSSNGTPTAATRL